MKFGLGLVIGKFYPPHRGHKLLIDTAAEYSKKVVVIVCARPSDSIPGTLRGRWLEEIHPGAEVMVIDDRLTENDSRIWAENTIRWLGRAPDAVFSSEDYGNRYATLMGSKHILVDQQRNQVPISGRVVRRDPYANWDFLEPVVRAWFAKRVCVMEMEPTGSTILAQTLAEQLNTVWAEEYRKEYTAEKMARYEYDWTTEEFLHIAWEQSRREEQAARRANRLVICDTNAFATALWHRRYMGRRSSELEAIAKNDPCDLCLLSAADGVVDDDYCEGEYIRDEMYQWIQEALTRESVPWKLLRGTPEERMDQAVDAVKELFVGSKWSPERKQVLS